MKKLMLFVATILMISLIIYINIHKESEIDSCSKIVELDDKFADFTFDQRRNYDSTMNKDYQLALVEVNRLDDQHKPHGLPVITSYYYGFTYLESLTEQNFTINDSRCMLYVSPQSEFLVEGLKVGEIYLFAFKDKTVSSYSVTGGELYISGYDMEKSYTEQSDDVKEQIDTARRLIEERVNKIYYFK